MYTIEELQGFLANVHIDQKHLEPIIKQLIAVMSERDELQEALNEEYGRNSPMLTHEEVMKRQRLYNKWLGMTLDNMETNNET